MQSPGAIMLRTEMRRCRVSFCCHKHYSPVMLSNVAYKDDNQRGYAMKNKLLTAVIAAAFVTVSGASWAQVAAGANSVPKYTNVEGSKNKKVTDHGVGANSAPKYGSMAASKNRKVSKHGVGANVEPVYPKTGTH
jgi:hypothetical protein